MMVKASGTEPVYLYQSEARFHVIFSLIDKSAVPGSLEIKILEEFGEAIHLAESKTYPYQFPLKTIVTVGRAVCAAGMIP